MCTVMLGRKAELGAKGLSPCSWAIGEPKIQLWNNCWVQSHYSFVSGSQEEGAQILTPPVPLMAGSETRAPELKGGCHECFQLRTTEEDEN